MGRKIKVNIKNRLKWLAKIWEKKMCSYCGRPLNCFVKHYYWDIINKYSCVYCFEAARKAAVNEVKTKCEVKK